MWSNFPSYLASNVPIKVSQPRYDTVLICPKPIPFLQHCVPCDNRICLRPQALCGWGLLPSVSSYIYKDISFIGLAASSSAIDAICRNGQAALFNYDTPGFLRRVASKAVCVRLEKLSTETLRQLCLPASEGEEEQEQESEEEELQAELVHRYPVSSYRIKQITKGK